MRDELKNFKEKEQELLEKITEARKLVSEATDAVKECTAAYNSVRTIADAVEKAEAIYKNLEQTSKSLENTLITKLHHLSDAELFEKQRELAANADELNKLVLQAERANKDLAEQVQKKTAELINAQRDMKGFQDLSKVRCCPLSDHH
jgi:soluble cytochrome b562